MTADEGEGREPVTKEVRLLVPIEKSDDRPKRVSYGVVLEPDTEDLQGDVMTAEDIEAAAYDWMERSQAGGHMHTATVEGAKVVESYIAPCDIPMETAQGRETIRKGSWVLAMRWPEDIWESIAKGDLTGYSVGGTGVRLALEHIGKKGKWAPGPNAGWRLANGDPAGEGAAAAGGGTPADRGAAAAREDDRRRRPKVGDVVRLKENGAVGTIVDYEPGKDGALDEYAIAPEDVGEGGPKALWFRADEIETVQGPAAPNMGDKVTFRDGVEAKIVGLSREHVLVEGPGVPNGTMAVGYDDIDSDGNIKLDAEYKPRYRGQYERPSAYGGGLAEQGDDALDGYPSGTVDDEQRYPTGGKWAGEDDASDAEREEAEWRAGYGQDASQGWEAEAGYKTYTRGQKVRTRTGQLRTVHSQRGAQVFVEEESNGWYHPSNLMPLYWSNELGWVTIPDREDEVKKSLTSIVREGLREAVDKHARHDQSTHGNWARGSGMRTADYGEFVSGDRVKLVGNEKIDWGSLEGATGRVVEVKPGTLGWPAIYSVKLDREWVGWEDDDTLRDIEATGLAMLRRVRKHGSHNQKDHGNWARGERSTEDATGMEDPSADLLDLFDSNVGATVKLDGHAYRVKEIKPFRFVHGLDAVILEPKDKSSAWYREQRAQLHDDWLHEVSDPERLVELARQLPGWDKFEEVTKDKGWAPGPNAGWRRITGEDGQPKKHTTRDGVVIEDQPKVTRVGGEQYQIAKPKGQVVLDFAHWKWLGTGGKPKSPPLHIRANWMVWPRGVDEDDFDKLIQSGSGKTLAEFMASLEPGEYKLAT